MQNKYYLKCVGCGHITQDFSQWFVQKQLCPKCHSKHSEVWYHTPYERLNDVFKIEEDSFWRYFDFLPLTYKSSKISCKEGAIPLENWTFLEAFAQKHYGIKCKVWIYRNDLNGGTGTFKDVAASLAAALFKEHGITQYIVASTGNTATAYSKYLALADILCHVFMPENSLKASEATINALGQVAYKVKGDYAKAKAVALAFANAHNILISSGNIDPIRVEAKKTMVFEWIRQINAIPDVYIQAISGGTGPIAIDKGIRELQTWDPSFKNPRFIMVQPHKCAPMVQAWEEAEKMNFPESFENTYPIIDNPDTCVPTLATGHPATYPVVAPLVKKTGGAFLKINEDNILDYARLIACEKQILLGPASAVCLAGFFKALALNKINNGETVLVNIGEGINRAPEFLNDMIYTTQEVDNVNTCRKTDRKTIKELIWKRVLKLNP